MEVNVATVPAARQVIAVGAYSRSFEGPGQPLCNSWRADVMVGTNVPAAIFAAGSPPTTAVSMIETNVSIAISARQRMQPEL